MNFESFQNIDIGDKQLLLDNCRAAERNIMISPSNALANSRAALEVLCKNLIKMNRVEPFRTSKGEVNLATMIETCLAYKFFMNEEAATWVRKKGNEALHAKEGTQKYHIVNVENVDVALKSVKSLYSIMQEVFPECRGEFSEIKIPFGFYEIVRAVPKAKNEVVFGDYNYFVSDPKGNCYYFQVIHRNGESDSKNLLGERNVLTGKRIKEDKGRKSYLLDVHYPSNLMAESDRDYIAYSVYEDSQLLAEFKENMFSEKDVVQIGIDLLNVLKELEQVGEGISLRNIQPGNVIITPYGDGYMASVVNMEAAKIHGYEATVYKSMHELLQGNAYLPREVRNADENAQLLWDKVDVYSVAMIMVYCMAPTLVAEEIDVDDLFDYFSEETAEILCDVLGSSLKEIDGNTAFMEKLKNVLDKL